MRPRSAGTGGTPAATSGNGTPEGPLQAARPRRRASARRRRWLMVEASSIDAALPVIAARNRAGAPFRTIPEIGAVITGSERAQHHDGDHHLQRHAVSFTDCRQAWRACIGAVKLRHYKVRFGAELINSPTGLRADGWWSLINSDFRRRVRRSRVTQDVRPHLGRGDEIEPMIAAAELEDGQPG